MTELIRYTAAETAAAVAKGEVSAVEVAQAHLDRIEAVDKKVNAFLHVDTEGALSAARAVDEKRAKGEELGPLVGVPLALKDVFTTKGVPTTCGSKILEGWIPPYDATLTARLKDSRRGHPRQDQHGRVRDGLLHRELRLRSDRQPVGPLPDPRRLRRRFGRRAGRLRGAAGDRHRHRRLDPPARRGHRHRRREADLRLGVALRPGRVLQQPGPGRPVRPDRAGRGAAARGDRRPRPAGLHLDRRPGPGRGRGREAARRARHADRRGEGVLRRGLPGRRDAALRRVGGAAARAGRRGRRGLLPVLHPGAAGCTT